MTEISRLRLTVVSLDSDRTKLRKELQTERKSSKELRGVIIDLRRRLMKKDTVYTTKETKFMMEIQSLKSQIKSLTIDLKKKEHQSLIDCFDFTTDDFQIDHTSPSSSSDSSSSSQSSDCLPDESKTNDKKKTHKRKIPQQSVRKSSRIKRK